MFFDYFFQINLLDATEEYIQICVAPIERAWLVIGVVGLEDV